MRGFNSRGTTICLHFVFSVIRTELSIRPSWEAMAPSHDGDQAFEVVILEIVRIAAVRGRCHRFKPNNHAGSGPKVLCPDSEPFGLDGKVTVLPVFVAQNGGGLRPYHVVGAEVRLVSVVTRSTTTRPHLDRNNCCSSYPI